VEKQQRFPKPFSLRRRLRLGLIASAGLVVLIACGQGGATSTTPYDLERGHYAAAVDRVATVVNCLNGEGFSASVYQDLSVKIDVPEEQMGAFAAVEDACWQAADERYPAAPPPTAEQLYDLYLEAAACLEAEGYPIPEPPTRDSWVDAYPGRVLWHPHSFVPNVGEETWLRLNRVCPQPGVR
jgi:hypothetical protein